MQASIAGQEREKAQGTAKGLVPRVAVWLQTSRVWVWLSVPLIGVALGVALYVAFTLRRDGEHDNVLMALLSSGCGFAFLLTAFMAGRQRNEGALRSIVLRLRRQNATLSYLSRHNAINGDDLHLELQALTARSADILLLERVSIWLLNEDHSELVCQCLYQRSKREYSTGFTLKASDYPRYFATLHDGRGFAADDAQNDPRTNEFTAGYLRPLGIGAMLDVPIRIDNQLAGVVCHEHVGGMRHWQDDEQNFAASIGDLASLAYESVRRHEAEKLLQQANSELEDKVAARTEALREANERLRAMDALKSRYLSSMSEQLEKTVADYDHVKQHDVLTSLPNRVFFNELLEQALSSGQRVAVVLVDLDSFKVINDSLGHVCGDNLLVELSERISQCLLEGDQVARIGSDEFAVLFHQLVDREQVAQFAQKLLFTLAAPTAIGPEPLSITASIGIAISPDDGGDRHALIKAADTAVFAAKGQGRNRYCFHTPEMSARASELHSIEQGLKRALEENHLSVHYQPQVLLATGELAGVEALARWQHPTLGMIPPVRFIPVAEACGLIAALGRWVLHAACRECAQWMPAMPAHVRLAVNVSARQLVDEDFVDSLRAVLLATGLPPERLELELTESTLQVIETSTRLLDEIKAMGVHIAIDDFGTGYSSLSVLKALPIDCLKIDKSFVNDMAHNPNDVAIVEAIIGMSCTLDLRTVAEGVETEAQLEVLRQLGCNIGQGYLFSRPLPAPALQDWLAASCKQIA